MVHIFRQITMTHLKYTQNVQLGGRIMGCQLIFRELACSKHSDSGAWVKNKASERAGKNLAGYKRACFVIHVLRVSFFNVYVGTEYVSTQRHVLTHFTEN